MKTLLNIVILATLMIGSAALAQTSAHHRSLFLIGPSAAPSETVILEGTVKGQKITIPPSDSDGAAIPNDVEGDE